MKLLDYQPIRLDTVVDILKEAMSGAHLRQQGDAEAVLATENS